ncbi:hypothetical protein FWC63_01770 [Candidatus Saccharibacteria bacterium]|nr:hypothetical protein [Candidatus Saccharibacteria bacterium]
MGKSVKTLVIKQQASWAVVDDGASGDKEANHILQEIERANETLGAVGRVSLSVRTARTPLERTRSRCVRELKHMFSAYLSGDYSRDDSSAVTLGQIEVMGELIEAEHSVDVPSDLLRQ